VKNSTFSHPANWSSSAEFGITGYNVTIRIGFGTQVAKTPTDPVIAYYHFVLHYHSPPTLQRDRRTSCSQHNCDCSHPRRHREIFPSSAFITQFQSEVPVSLEIPKFPSNTAENRKSRWKPVCQKQDVQPFRQNTVTDGRTDRQTDRHS